VWRFHSGPAGAWRIVFGFAAALLMVQSYIPPLSVGLNTPGWSISCEAFFYAIWPQLVGRLRSVPPRTVWLAVAVLWFAGISAPAIGIQLVRRGMFASGFYSTLLDDVPGSELLARALAYFPLLRLPEFAMGIIVGHGLRKAPVRSRSIVVDTLREFGLLCATLLCSWMLGSGLVGKLCGLGIANRIAIESGTMAPIFAVIVWQLARGNGLARRLLSVPAIVALGEASYALYILQEPVVVWTTAVLKRLTPDFSVHSGSFFLGYLLLLTSVSLLVHRTVEQSFRKRILAWLAPGTARS
jgi:peptidoglycan/LPS O-acetylase OafA/YrhL